MQKQPVSEIAVVSLIVAFLSFTPLANLGCAVLAVVLGIIALKRIASPQSNLRGEGFAAGGVVLGSIAALISLSFLIKAIHFFQANPELLKSLAEKAARP
ncbi:MAG: DUF4190 domain-containing protein [Candidatus Omnitrophota bacterium]